MDVEKISFQTWCREHRDALISLNYGVKDSTGNIVVIPEPENIENAMQKVAPKMYEKVKAAAIAMSETGASTHQFYRAIFDLALGKDPQNKPVQPPKAQPPKRPANSNTRVPPAWEVRITGEASGDSDIEFVLTPDGIIKETTTYDKEGKPRTSECTIWYMTSFGIDMVLTETMRDGYHEWFNFHYEGHIELNKDLDQMTAIMLPGCINYHYKAVFQAIIREYVRKKPIPRINLSNQCGFTTDGWVLPGAFQIKALVGIQQEGTAHIEEMTKLVVDRDTAIQHFKALYDAVHIEFKDHFFAWGIIQPFLYALRDHTNLLPWIAAESPNGDYGKSQILKLMTKRLWGYPRQLLSKDLMNSGSRGEDYFSTSTFAIVLDDCGDFNDELKSDIKTYSTQECYHQRKDKNHQLKQNRPMAAPIAMTMNRPNDMFDDLAFLTRGINHKLTRQMTDDDKKTFDTIKHVPDGYIGRYIIECTKDWKLANLVDLYSKQPGTETMTDPRANAICRIYQVAAEMGKQFFDVDLDVSGIQAVIDATLKMYSEEIPAVIKVQLKEAIKKEVKVGFGEHEHVEWQFKPSERWITAEVFVKCDSTDDIVGYFYTSNNMQDLKNRTGKKSLNMDGLCSIIGKIFKGVRYESQWIPDLKKNLRCLYIPNVEEHEDNIVQSTIDDFSQKPKERLSTVVGCIKGLWKESGGEPLDRACIIERLGFAPHNIDETSADRLITEAAKQAFIVIKRDGSILLIGE